jgi:hypothetical protein
VLLLWALGLLVVQLVLMLILGAWLQVRHKRWNRMRIACLQKWENEIVHYLYGEVRDANRFGPLDPDERRFFIPFLLRVLGTLAGSEGQAVRELYHQRKLHRGLRKRLVSRQQKPRAMAALEVGSFHVEEHYGRLQELLSDPIPHVAHAAARGLGNTQRMEFAEPVLQWVLHQEVFQKERLLWILESFGAEFMRWMEARLDAAPDPDPDEVMIYAQLAASTRRVEDPSRLVALLESSNTEVAAAAIKALGAIGSPEGLPFVMPLATHPSWIIRAQAAKAIGILAGPGGVPSLLTLICDARFEVRRNAAQALLRLGPAGVEALRVVAEDVNEDPFARDLARERLQWIDPAVAS